MKKLFLILSLLFLYQCSDNSINKMINNIDKNGRNSEITITSHSIDNNTFHSTNDYIDIIGKAKDKGGIKKIIVSVNKKRYQAIGTIKWKASNLYLDKPVNNVCTILVNNIDHELKQCYKAIKSFTRLSDFPPEEDNEPVAYNSCSYVEQLEKIYCAGGIDKYKQVKNFMYSYDIKTDKWEKLLDMPSPRYSFSIVNLGKKLYIIGGVHSYDKTKPENYLGFDLIYDIDNNSYEYIPEIPEKRHGHMAIANAIANIVFVINGRYDPNGIFDFSRNIYIYIPELNQWVDTNITKSYGAGGFIAADNEFEINNGYKFYILGGEIHYGPHSGVKSLEIPNIREDFLKSMSTGRAFFAGAMLVAPNNKKYIYVIGGSDEYNFQNNIIRYDITENNWENVTPSSVYFVGGAYCKVKNSIFLVGGLLNGITMHKKVYRYSPFSD